MTVVIVVQPIEVAEAALVAAQADARAAREHVRTLAGVIAVFDLRIQRAHARRKAADDSMRATLHAMHRCGLKVSMVSNSISRHKRRSEDATVEIRSIVAEAASTCDAFDVAWNNYLACRSIERTAIAGVRAAVDASLRNIQGPSIGASRVRHASIVAQLAEHDNQMQVEMKWYEANEDEDLDDEHFDPKYDTWEIQRRRARPWL